MFHDQVEFSLGFDNLIELDNIRMPYLFKNLNLPRNPVNIRLVLDFIFFQYLDGHFFICDRLDAELDLTKGTLTQCLLNFEMGYLFKLRDLGLRFLA